MATWIPTVRTIVDGNPVNGAYTNTAISDLVQRTDWLKNQLSALAAGAQLVLNSQTVEAGVVPGMAVYLDDTTNTFKRAIAEADTVNSTAAPEALWQGVVSTVSGTSATIVIGGSLTLAGAVWNSAYESGTFAAGDVYLSSTAEGKLTTSPGSLGIYIGHMRSTGELLVRLGSQGNYLQHVHLERAVLGKPAGTVVDPAFAGTHSVNTPSAAQQGWLPANNTYFPGYVVGVQIPTGAKFGYNIQHASETALRAIFPTVPPNNAQLSQGGVLISSSKVQINQYGIWWMDDTYGNAPWPVDYAATTTATNFVLWTTRVVANAELVDVVQNAIYSQLQTDIPTLAVSSIIPANNADLEVASTTGDIVNGFKGAVTVTNKGVTALKPGRGTVVSGTLGDATNGWKGIVNLDVAVDQPAQHLWTELTVAGDKVGPISTNGVLSGTSINLRGHVLGATTATDYIDFIFKAGNDLQSGELYTVTLQIAGAVDTIAGTPTPKNFDIAFYRLANGSAASSTSLVRTTQAQMSEGVPGNIQTVTVGPFADVKVAAGDVMLVRIKANTGGTPITPGKLRVLAVNYGLTKV